MSDVVTFEKQGQIGFITLNRPEARNAVNGAVAQAFESALDQLENDPEVWVGILQANTEGQERPVFCALLVLFTAIAKSQSSLRLTVWQLLVVARSCLLQTW
jgi:hypothetical protein